MFKSQFIVLILVSILLSHTCHIFVSSCGEYAHLFTQEEYDIIASKPVRKEIRQLTDEEWDDVVDGMWKMKNLITEVGVEMYGDEYESWDRLLCRHMTATSDEIGDQGHSQPAFIIFHRALLMQYEKILWMVKPDLKIGFPYWHWGLDAYDTDESDVWGKYLGPRVGNPEEDYQVTTGPFAYWPVRINDDLLDTQCDVHNAYGFMRNPIVPLKTPYVTRFGGNICDSYHHDLGNASYFYDCLEFPQNISAWHYCIDAYLHGPIHPKVGGTKRLYNDYEPGDDCYNWEIGVVGSNMLTRNVFPPEFDCFEYPECNLSQPITDCQCYPKHGTWCVINGTNHSLLAREQTSYVGDFWDVTGSPNDPIFPFHHINMDKHFSLWQLKNYDLKDEYYEFPIKDYGRGGKLDDVSNKYDPFINLFPWDSSLDDKPLTIRDILDHTDFIDQTYVYDVVLEAIDRQGCNFDDFEDIENDVEIEQDASTTWWHPILNWFVAVM